jgi:hypothetical protein
VVKVVTVNEAYEYFNNERLFSEPWLISDSKKQEQSLKMAENQIMSLMFNSYTENKEAILKKAICEQALYLIETLSSSRGKLINQGVTSFSVEGLSENYDVKARKTICVEARTMLKPYMLGVASIC